MVRQPPGSSVAFPNAIQAAVTFPAGTHRTPRFRLVDHHGRAFDNISLEENWAVVSIGYRGCTDPCPGSLSAMATAQATLLDIDAAAAGGRWLMITLDPEQDPPAALTRYLSGFSEQLRGLTGDVENLTTLVAALSAGNTPVPGQIWLIAPGGDIRGRFDPPIKPDALVSDIRFLRRQ